MKKRKEKIKIRRKILQEYKAEHLRRDNHDNTWYRACCVSLPLFLDFIYKKYHKDYLHATQENVQAFVTYLETEHTSKGANKKLSRRSINFYLADVKGFYRWLKESRKINHNPAKDVKRLKVTTPNTKNKFLKPHEILEIVDWVEKNSKTPKRDVAIIGLMFDPWGNTGCMRMGEVTALDLDEEDVNFKENFINITKTMGMTKVENSTKTHFSRTIAMTSKIKEILLDYIENERLDPVEGNPLFVGSRDRRRLAKTTVNDMFRNIEKNSGLKFRFKLRSHLGRHSATTKLANSKDISLQYLKRVTGTRRMEVLEGYMHDITDEDREIAEGNNGDPSPVPGRLASLKEQLSGLSKEEKLKLLAELI